MTTDTRAATGRAARSNDRADSGLAPLNRQIVLVGILGIDEHIERSREIVWVALIQNEAFRAVRTLHRLSDKTSFILEKSRNLVNAHILSPTGSVGMFQLHRIFTMGILLKELVMKAEQLWPDRDNLATMATNGNDSAHKRENHRECTKHGSTSHPVTHK